MTARIKRFYTRADLGMRKPTGVSHNITPQNGGVAGHHGGGGPNPAPTTFEAAKRIWLGWQNYHMNGQGWRDIAYTAGYDNLGNVYAGRGLNVRSGANGSNFGNQNYYAFVWIGGGSAVPSQAAKDAFEWLVYWARTKGNAGMRVRPHYAFTATSCAGRQLSPFIISLDNKKIVLPSGPFVNTDRNASPNYLLPSGHWYGVNDKTKYSHSGIKVADRDEIRKIQIAINKWLKSKDQPVLSVDGRYGPKTARAVTLWQRSVINRLADKSADGKFGRNSWNVMF